MSKATDTWVNLRKHPLRCPKLPIDVRMALNDGRYRVSRIRAEIAGRAKVNVMPPVEILDVGWTTPNFDGIVHGCATPIQVGRNMLMGVRLTGPIVITGDDGILRSVLLHEFAHCFNATRRVLAAIADGRNEIVDTLPPSEIFENEAWDRERLDPPDEWFSEDDCKVFIYQHDAALGGDFEQRMLEGWAGRELPMEVPNLRYEVAGLSVPSEYSAHIAASATK